MMTQQTSLVSVVIPTYNRAHVLKRTIDSILQSTHPNIEIVVVDDGSTDDTRSLMQSLSDPRIRYILREKNNGLSAARNKGIQESRGDFVALCDSDDQFLPDKIQKSVDTLKTLPSNFGMVASNHYNLFPNGERTIGVLEKNPRRIFSMPSTWVFRRDALQVIGSFDSRLWAGEDTEFLNRFRSRYKFYFIDEPLIIKHASPDNFFANKEKLLKLRKLSADNVKGEARLYALMLFIYAKDLWKCGQKDEAKKLFLKAFLSYPLKPKYFVRYLMCFLKPNEGVVWADQ